MLMWEGVVLLVSPCTLNGCFDVLTLHAAELQACWQSDGSRIRFAMGREMLQRGLLSLACR